MGKTTDIDLSSESMEVQCPYCGSRQLRAEIADVDGMEFFFCLVCENKYYPTMMDDDEEDE